MTLEERVKRLERELAEMKIQAELQPLKEEIVHLEYLKHRITQIVPPSAERQDVLTALEERCCSLRSLLQQREELLRQELNVQEVGYSQTV
jgi:hypothetical protein